MDHSEPDRASIEGAHRSRSNPLVPVGALHYLPGTDHRTSAARRYAALAMSFADQLGGEKAMSEGQKALVRQAAAMTLQAEAMQAAIVAGKIVDPDALVRVANSLSRMLRELGISEGGSVPAAEETLEDHLRATSQERTR